MTASTAAELAHLEGVTPLDARRMRVDDHGAWALLGGQCASCGHITHPFHRGCRYCDGSQRLIELVPAGEVRSVTTVRTTRPDVLLAVPYQDVLVALRDGPVISVPSLESAPFTIGEQVTLVPMVLDTGSGPRAIFAVSHSPEV